MLFSRCLVPLLRTSVRRYLPLRSCKAFISSADLTTCQQKLNFIDGHRCHPCTEEGPGEIHVTNPTTGHVLCVAKGSGKEEVNRAVQSSRKAFKSWSALSGSERGRILHNASRIVRSRKDEIAKMEVTDNGRCFENSRPLVGPHTASKLTPLLIAKQFVG